MTQEHSDPHREVQTGNVALVRRNARWLLVPMSLTKAKDASVNPRTSDRSVLTSMADLLGSPKVFKAQRDLARSAACLSNLKIIALQAIRLSYEEKKLAITPQNFKARLSPSLGKMSPNITAAQIFRCPSVSSGESYSFNGNLTGLSADALINAPRLVMFYEGKNGQLDFRHDEKANVAFANGYVQAVSREEAKTLQWKP